MNTSESRRVAPFRGYTCRELYKFISDSDAPEQVVRQLPPQSLFMLVKHNGLASSADILQMASLEQCRLLSDFDLWHKDSLNEDNLWDWLAVTDATESLELLQKIVKFIDLKVLAVLIGKYTDVKIFEEPVDMPPGPGYHSPDQGFTWVGINTENADHHFLLARLLALIFESSTELYYQLMSIPSVASVTMLEEESFVERNRRLASEGIPEPENAAESHNLYPLVEARSDLEKKAVRGVVEDIRSIEPLVYESRATRYFADLMKQIVDHEAIEMEMTFLMNSAIVRFGIDFCEQDQVLALAEKVKGAINIGLERLTHDGSIGVKECYDILGLGKLYRSGFTELMSLRSAARKLSPQELDSIRDDAVTFSAIACAREAFPEMPYFLKDDGNLEGTAGSLPPGQRAIETLQAMKTIRAMISEATAAS